MHGFGLARAIARVTAATLLAGAPVRSAWAHSGSHARPADQPRDAAFDFAAPEPGTYRLPAIKPAPDGVVLDASGSRGRLHERMAGKVIVLSFVYTRCTDARGCPLATAVLHQVHQATKAARRAPQARHAQLRSGPRHARRDGAIHPPP